MQLSVHNINAAYCPYFLVVLVDFGESNQVSDQVCSAQELKTP